MDLHQIQSDILAEMVPASTMTDDDTATLAEHRSFLRGIEDRVVDGFYDTLYAHPATADVFVDGERPAREATLRDWWRRTVDGPIDDRYWAWMALVGIVHIRRGVRNPMMLSMVGHVENAVHAEALAARLPPTDVERLRLAFSHLATTVSAVISESYTQSYVGALQNLGGLNPRLLANMLGIEIQAIEDAGRASLG